ncbi:hypothetical protein ACQ4LE_010145 [Meloidogyne hapla]|uniref:Uncharacterized protein n=1 Tax=Meloidogyne hapla TaxID=6305 RepID=A0A1I8AZN8_MELHA
MKTLFNFSSIILFTFFNILQIINGYYPVNNFDENKNEAVDTILTRPQSLYRRFAPMARGAFVSPLFGYRFLSLDPPYKVLEETNNDEINENVNQNNILDNPSSSSKSSHKYDQLFLTNPTKRNFYTHIWRDIVQRMPAYRDHDGRRLFQSVERDEPLLAKRNPTDRMHAMRVG